MGHDVYRAADFDILPLNPNVSAQNPPHPVERHLLALVRSHLLGGHFLFSYGWDLSTRLQTQCSERDNGFEKSLWEQVSAIIGPKFLILTACKADDRFFWNKCALCYLFGKTLTTF